MGKKKSGPKVCKCCGETDEGKFYPHKGGYKGLRALCKNCKKREQKDYRINNIDKRLNIEAKYRGNNKDSISKQASRWAGDNKEKGRLSVAQRRSVEKRAMPKDSTFMKIKVFRNEAGDKGLAGDHIIPIQGKLPDGRRVMGCHSVSNMQMITGSENSIKGYLITYEDLEGKIEFEDYIFVPDDYFKTILDNKYPNIGFDVL
mgnify:CR=1 FL=1|tara:strand:+ start:1504 stop:2109 length:606 start_codon:yes stop_codon:yes gene_type:complete